MLSRLFILLIVSNSWFVDSSAQTINENKPSNASLLQGKGTLSFKINGKLYRSDSSQTKCWTSPNVPLAILWGKGLSINISWQIQNYNGKGAYRLDNDSKGKINFTLEGKTYWVRKTDGSNYLDIVITGIKDNYSVKLLSGTFEGVLEDGDGNKVRITQGVFVTNGI
ncbi:MAG: DUF6252 family protein [Bacteroidota bacterium]|nr:DUF6252 family protein [Bacteroidota bacterium]